MPTPAVRTMKPPDGMSSSAAQHLDQLPQTVSFAVRFDLSRNADVFDRRHVNEKTTRQRDVRSDAGALLGNRFLGDLDENLLSFIQQIRNRWLLPISISSLRAGIIARTLLAVARRRFGSGSCRLLKGSGRLRFLNRRDVCRGFRLFILPVCGSVLIGAVGWSLVLTWAGVVFCHRVASRTHRESDSQSTRASESSRPCRQSSSDSESTSLSVTLLARFFAGAFLLAALVLVLLLAAGFRVPVFLRATLTIFSTARAANPGACSLLILFVLNRRSRFSPVRPPHRHLRVEKCHPKVFLRQRCQQNSSHAQQSVSGARIIIRP